jgi:hypothetical protein
MKLSRASACFLCFLVIALPAAAQSYGERAVESASDDVPAPTAARARSVAEGSARLRAYLAQPRTIFIGVDLIRRKGDDDRDLPPLYRVQHYRYADDSVITSIVDLDGGRVAEQIEERNVPVRLTEGELIEARELAFADRRVAEAIGQYRERLVVGPLVVRTSDRADPWFGRRIVRLLFRLGADYLSAPIVFVDLTRRQVIIQPGHRPAYGERR